MKVSRLLVFAEDVIDCVKLKDLACIGQDSYVRCIFIHTGLKVDQGSDDLLAAEHDRESVGACRGCHWHKYIDLIDTW